MDARFSEDQLMIKEAASSFLQDWKAEGGFRALSDKSSGYDEQIWKAFGCELGFAGLTIEEATGGSGLGDIDRALIMEEMGRVLFMSPFFSHSVLAADLLQATKSDQAQAALQEIAQGEMVYSVAMLDHSKLDDGKLSGEASQVIEGASADRLVIAGVDFIGLITTQHAGVTIKPLKTLDPTRQRADILLDNVKMDVLYEGDRLTDIKNEAKARSAIALAAEQIGGADTMLSETVAYALERKQFGRVIGSFQAIKHRCADMMIAIEAARSAVYLAAAMAHKGGDSVMEHAAIAKSEASEAYYQVCANAIQIHGGVGVTWEFDQHFHFKRARAGKALLGSPEEWRDVLSGFTGLKKGAA